MRTDQTCYGLDETIEVDMFNCEPEDDDWVGIWSNEIDTEIIGNDFSDWKWSCGTVSCLGSASSLVLNFDARTLGVGEFRAFLLDAEPKTAPFKADAISRVFRVGEDCE